MAERNNMENNENEAVHLLLDCFRPESLAFMKYYVSLHSKNLP